MLKTRTLKGAIAFYESTTGINIDNIRSVSFASLKDVVVTVVYKDGVPWVYLPMRHNNPLVRLQDAIDKMDMVITKVA